MSLAAVLSNSRDAHRGCGHDCRWTCTGYLGSATFGAKLEQPAHDTSRPRTGYVRAVPAWAPPDLCKRPDHVVRRWPGEYPVLSHLCSDCVARLFANP